MDVGCGEKLLATSLQPAVASPGLTLGAVPIPTRVVRDGTMSTASAFIQMTAERGGTTTLNGPEHFHMLPGDPFPAAFDECISCGADEIGHLEGWPGHLIVLRWAVFELQ
jgi:hypothetical protein